MPTGARFVKARSHLRAAVLLLDRLLAVARISQLLVIDIEHYISRDDPLRSRRSMRSSTWLRAVIGSTSRKETEQVGGYRRWESSGAGGACGEAR